MAIIPKDKKWIQPNNGDSFGNLFATWNIDFDANRGSATVSNPLKNVFDETDDADLARSVAAFVEYDSKLWAVSNELFKTSTAASTDITLTANWAQDATASSPNPGATVTDAVVFDSLLLVQDGDDIFRYNGSTWASWWKTALGQSGLTIGQKFILKVGPDGNLYITDGGNKVYRVTPAGVVTKTGAGTLDFSATPHILNCATTTSTRIFYGTEDSETENAVIIDWDMGPQSISANKIHEMGVKRVLCLATWNDTPIAILSDGSIKYHNGVSFVDWKGAHLPQTKNQYQSNILHKNGWAIIDNMLHFLINPTVDIDDTTLVEDTSNYWNYPAGIYCLDPEVGLYCRYALNDGALQHRQVSTVGALYARNHKNTKFFASYEFWNTTTTETVVIACEDNNKAIASTAWLNLIPLESVDNFIKKLTVVQKRMGTGDSINLYYRRYDEDAIRIEGTWANTTTFNTTDTVTGIENGWVGFVKAGNGAGFLSRIKSFTDATTSEITFEDANANATAQSTAVMEFVNFKYMGSITNTGVEISDFTIPQPQRSRQVWIWLELKQAAGNDLQLDYLISK